MINPTAPNALLHLCAPLPQTNIRTRPHNVTLNVNVMLSCKLDPCLESARLRDRMGERTRKPNTRIVGLPSVPYRVAWTSSLSARSSGRRPSESPLSVTNTVPPSRATVTAFKHPIPHSSRHAYLVLPRFLLARASSTALPSPPPYIRHNYKTNNARRPLSSCCALLYFSEYDEHQSRRRITHPRFASVPPSVYPPVAHP